MSTGWRTFGVPWLALLAGACTTLPDTSGYTAATIEVKQAVASAGTIAQTEIDTAAGGIGDADARRSVETSGQAFAAAWGVTLGSLDASVGYAESIEEIARSGNSGRESANAVAASVSQFAGALGLAVGPAGAAVTETGAFIYGEIAKIRAARSLQAALAAADPAIVRLQELIRAQVASARTIFLRALSAQTRAIDNEAALGLYPRRDAELEAEEKLRLGDLTDVVLHQPQQTARIAALKARIAIITETRAALADGVRRYDGRIADIAQRRKAGLVVFGSTDAAIGAWAAAHARLASAVRDRQAVDAASLGAAVADLRAVVQKWREL